MTKVRSAAASRHPQDTGTAIEGLEAVAPCELGNPIGLLIFSCEHAYVRGKHIWQRIKAPPAAIEFQKILDHPLSARYGIIGAPAYPQPDRP